MIKYTLILKRYAENEEWASFDNADAMTEDEQAVSTLGLFLPRRDYTALGSPDTITVSIAPGDMRLDNS